MYYNLSVIDYRSDFSSLSRLSNSNACRDRNTHSTVDGPERHKSLDMVGQVSAVGVPVRVLTSLQDKLLSLEIMMFITNPAEERKNQC